MTVKIVETGGVSLKNKLVRTDLSGCLFLDCKLCEDGMRSGSHTRRGCVYQGQCKLCKDEAVTSTYHGESGRSGYYRTDQHVTDIKNADKKNAFVKHSINKHPEHLRDPSIFEFKVNSTFKSCLDRQVREGVNIASDKSDELMNSKTEYHQPSITGVTTTREVDVMRSQGR